MKKLLSLCLVIFAVTSLNAQTADEIINNYFENTGGKEAWLNLKGIKMNAKVNQGGLEIPLEIYQMADGRQLTKITFQGLTIKQGVFDGTTLWNTNFQTMKAEKADAEATAMMAQESQDFPDALVNYVARGYTAELIGKETIDGTETFKVKLTKKPLTIDGQQVDNINYYYFESENFVPILVETTVKQGPQKGAISQTKMSEYQEVGGLYFPFALEQGIKGVGTAPLKIDAIVLNPELPASEFAFPEQQ
ncbi:outer membrane lipoprotein-sorting protein [bacterium]|nr:MAG: outer membrane lipoprotein-sorting protein [bacterium]